MTVYTLGNGGDAFTSYQAPGWSSGSVVYGGRGDDTIVATGRFGVTAYGENGNDTLVIGGFRSPNGSAYGGNGDDVLSVLSSSDHVLDGGRGDDVLISASGPISGLLSTARGALMTGGPGDDTFVLDSSAYVFVFADPDGVLSEGDIVRGIIDVVADYEGGELLDLPGTPTLGAVGASGSTIGPNYLTTLPGEYGIVRGTVVGLGQFNVSADGTDLLLLYQGSGGTDADVEGAVAIRGVTQSELLLIG